MAQSMNEQANDFVRKLRGFSTIWKIAVERDAVAYRYDLDVLSILPGRGGGPSVEKSLTKGADDGLKALNKELAYELLALAFTQTQMFGLGNQPVDVIYDQKSVLFSSVPLCPQRVEVRVGVDDTLIRDHYGPQARFVLELRPCKDKVHKVRLADLAQYVKADDLLLAEDRSHRTFFEMAFSMFAVNENTYTQIGAGRLFRVAPVATDLGNGIALRPGLAKGVRVVEGTNGKNDAYMSLVVDAKTSPYFKSQNLLDTVREIVGGRGQFPPAQHAQWRNAIRFLKDVRVITTYGERKRTFPIGGFTEQPIGQLSIDYTDKATGVRSAMSVAAYFQQKYSIRLQHPELPAVKKAGPGQNDSVYPLELLEVMRDQRVPLEKMECRLSERLLHLNAVRPNDRLNSVMEHLEQIGAFGNDVLAAFGIQLLPNSNTVSIGVRQPPELMFGRGQLALSPVLDRANWSRESARYTYLESGDVAHWVVLRSQRDGQVVDAFLDRLMRASGFKGMRLGRPQCFPLNGDLRDYHNFSSQLENALKTNPRTQFLLVISPKMDGSHDLLKYFEARNKRVVTQQLAIEKVGDVVNKGQSQTLDNILHKLNVKNHGLNYSLAPSQTRLGTQLGHFSSPLDMTRPDAPLVMGFDIAHPTQATGRERADLQKRGITGVDSLDPSVVGITANMGSNPYAFSGDYFYQTSRKEAIDTDQLEQRVKWMCSEWQRNNPGKPMPTHVVVTRDGVSEGQYAMVVELELAAVRNGCRAHDPRWKPKILLVVATKRHSNRFFQQAQNGNGGGQSAVENLQPGSVMQGAGVSRLDAVHFFMQAHYPLKGCGKAVQYTVLCDEIGVSHDQLQSFLMALCYSHQIVFSAVSLPEPVYQADELAKRGSNNYRMMKQIEGVPRVESGLPDYKAVNEHLSYMAGGGACTIPRFTA